MVPNVIFDLNVNRNNVTLMLSWGEPFNGYNHIVSYTVSCSGDVTCPSSFTTTDNTTRRYTITSLTPVTNYTFSVVATNSVGNGEASVVMITTPSTVVDRYVAYIMNLSNYVCTYLICHFMKVHAYICAYVCICLHMYDVCAYAFIIRIITIHTYFKFIRLCTHVRT